MRLLKVIGLATLALNIGACQSLFKPDDKQPIASTTQKWEHRPAGCSASDCPLVNVELQLPEGDATLNARILRDLLALTRELPGDPSPPSLQVYEQDFLARAKPGWSSYLQAKILEQHDRLMIIELSSYRFDGGAHGIPGRSYINYDTRLKKVLTLQDILVPGEEETFWQTARLAHQAWLVANGHADDREYIETWPFERTDNIAFNYGSVLLKYDVDRIAPYTVGHPELKIPYPRLNGIVKPQYFPGRG
ncbi:RsiV family protein [Pseudomonas sp. LRF_L74]|uniref:RsiV family protein n=1 Tax=Pseudomonas sp. LRF_L74 TaxID=3369422 RepID=UPI003F640157